MEKALRIYHILLEKNFSRDEIDDIVNDINIIARDRHREISHKLATREDINKLKDDINNHKVVIRGDIDKLKEDISKLAVQSKGDMNKIILWVAALILGQMLTIFGILNMAGVFDR